MINIRDNPQHTDIDGSILWVIDTYTEDEWFHTLTKLNKYCFLIHEESDYLNYINPIARQNGAYCSNLLDFIEYYESEGFVVHKEHSVKGEVRSVSSTEASCFYDRTYKLESNLF